VHKFRVTQTAVRDVSPIGLSRVVIHSYSLRLCNMTRLEWQIFQVKHEKVLLHAFWLFFSFGYVVSLGFHIETQPEGRFEGSFAFFPPFMSNSKHSSVFMFKK